MIKKPVPFMVGIAFLCACGLPAQSANRTFKKMQNQRLGTVRSINRPTPVKGEGVTTPSGVKYWDIQIGEGTPAERGRAVKLLYAAWVDNGKEFADSLADGKPTIFTLGAGQVIAGWEQGVEGMKPGGKRQIRIPPGLAYGATGLPPAVPPNSSLIFDVELLEVQ
jgi:peptidylprolyl isomerase